ncbi:carboxylesterase/lipase family protein [Streptomyces sp. CA2R106]|uniref:carboxylesterase/lipase family protein n=1 Tax=Streptomyces sp. CA2R106 TaxID=3120153 RepID=UPI00300B4DEA
MMRSVQSVLRRFRLFGPVALTLLLIAGSGFFAGSAGGAASAADAVSAADASATATTSAVSCTAGTTVRPAAGPLCGIDKDATRSYLGVPYAAAPVGDLRWQAPQPRTPWTSVFSAVREGAACPQPVVEGEAPPAVMSEDCLNLDIQEPTTAAPGAKLPVIVDIHFGGFLLANPLDNSEIASNGHAVVVSINYRLGILGFLADKSLGAHSGDYGLQDQYMALRWVRQNIAAFGGDPENVTLEGSSAGGASVCAAMASPEAKGLFQKGISESGFYNYNDDTIWWTADCKSDLPTEAQAQELGASFAAKVGCGSSGDVAACLRAVPEDTLVTAAGQLFTPTVGGAIGPIVNGTTLPVSPAQAFATGRINQASLVIGVARDEINGSIYQPSVLATTPAQYKALLTQQFGDSTAAVMARYPLARYPDSSPLIAYRTVMADAFSVCPSLRAAAELARHTTVFSYVFDDTDALSPNGGYPLGSPHSGQVVYLSPDFFEPPAVQFDPDQAAFRDQLVAQWSGFARTGNPTVDGAPAWSPFRNTSGATGGLVMDLAPAGDSVLTPASVLAQQHNCGFWQQTNG